MDNTHDDEHVLVLRTCAADMTAYGNSRWPQSGPVEAPDWNPAPVCGQGLHGLLWGEGDATLLSWEPEAKWLAVKVRKADIVDLGGKVKYPRGEVVACGERQVATRYILVSIPFRSGHDSRDGLYWAPAE